MNYRKALAFVSLAAGVILLAQKSDIFPIFKSNVMLGRQGSGEYLLPTNQLLRPWGEQMPIRGRPVDLSFDSQKRLLAC